jgi:hypothetical protein
VRIPVFVSRPTALSASQEASCKIIYDQIENLNLEARTLGRSDYSTEFPLREVYGIAKHCSGGVILGFEQFHSDSGTWKRGSRKERKSESEVVLPSPWNHLEAGILFSLRLPLLVFREPGIAGGVFDSGASDLFVNDMPDPTMDEDSARGIRDVFLKWQGIVRAHYYRWG